MSVIATLSPLLLAASVLAGVPPQAQPATGALRITVAVTDSDRKPTPVPRHALLISDNPATSEPRQVITRLDGTIDVTLRAGSYIVESDRPVAFQGKAYRWTQTVDVVAGAQASLALTLDNAEVEDGADPSATVDDDAAFLLPQLSDRVVGLWTPTAHASGFVIDANGLVVTNQQVVGTATMVEVQLSASVKVAARVLVADAAKDVAVLWMDPSVAPPARSSALACSPAITTIAVGQPLVAIGVSLRQQKEILSAKVGAIEPGGIGADLVVASGSLGGPVFTPRGEFVGLTSTVPDKDANARPETRVVRAADVCGAVATAAPAMKQGPRPTAARLPVERVRPVPVEALEAAAARRGGSLNPYVVTGSAFEAAFITPMATFGTEYQAEQLRERRRSAGARLLDAEAPPPDPLLEFSNWSDYVWDFPPVLLVRVTPKLVERFWTTVGRAAAMTQGVALPPIKRYKSGFSRLQAFCGDVEVTPIHPFKVERRTSETEAIYEGLYAYDPEALGPHCASVTLVMYSEKEPGKGDSRVVDPAILRQVWQDFAPYRAAASAQDQGRPAWLRRDSARFEIHYPPALAADLEAVTRAAERAYDRVGGRLRFALRTKVPLVMFAPSGPLPRDEVVAYAVSDTVAPQHPHRARLVLPLPEREAEREALIVHELTHLLVMEVLLPSQSGDGGLPRWIQEGLASYMVGVWREDDERQMRTLAASGEIPALSRLSGTGGFANPRLNDLLGHAAFDFIESRWGAAGLRRFVDGLIVPRVDKTYDAVFELTPADFDAAFRQYAAARFGPAAR